MSSPLKPYCIVFAAPVGAGKTTIAYYLSRDLWLPIYNNDALRAQLKADMGGDALDEDLVRHKRDEILKEMLSSGKSFIVDASVDREWAKFKQALSDNGYGCFIVSIDISREFLDQLTSVRGDSDSEDQVANWFRDHQNFIKEYKADIGISIDDHNYVHRLEIVQEAIRQWLAKL